MRRLSPRFWLCGLLLLVVTSGASAEPQLRFVLPPVQVSPQAGSAETEHVFTLQWPVACPCVLRIANGGVRAAWVWLDGVMIVAPPEITHGTTVVEKSIHVSAGQHRFAVRVEGPPDTSATLSVTGTIPLPDLSQPRAGHTATTMSNGDIFIFGGTTSPGHGAESFAPRTLTFTPAQVASAARFHHTAVVLPTADLWIAAGTTADAVTAATEIIEPVSGLEQVTPTLPGGRTRHAAVVLGDGRVLVIGGQGSSGTALRSGEMFDPRPDPFSDGTYNPLDAAVTTHDDLLVHARTGHTATLLPSGLVLGRLTDIVRGSRRMTVAYDAQHRPVSITDPLQRETTFDYDAAGRVLSQRLPGNREVLFSYDDKGNVTSVTPPGRSSHAFGYTAIDGVNSYTPPAVPGTGATNYRYDRDGQILAIDRPGNQTIGFGYDTGGRLDTINFSRGSLTYGYDAAGRVASIGAPDAPGLVLTYDGFLSAGERWTGVIEGSVERTFGTDLLLQSERVNGTNGAFPVTFGSYDRNGLPNTVGAISLTRHPDTADVTSVTLGSTTETRGYNSTFAEPAMLSLLNPFFQTEFRSDYTRDALGRIEQNIETVDGIIRVFEYGYDPAGRLRTVQRNGTLVVLYTYDANGNRLRAEGEQAPVNATNDDQDRLLTYGANSYTYGPNGELASRTRFGQTTQYEYDSLGNLVRVLLPDDRVIRYVIDGRGRRVAKYIDNIRMRAWLYGDQLRPIAELDEAGAVVARFVYASRSNVPDAIIRGGDTYRLFADHLGSPRIILNASTGEVVQRMDFGPFGERLQDSNPGFQPFGFAGGLYDPDTGLVRFGARLRPRDGAMDGERSCAPHRWIKSLRLCRERSC